MGGGEFVRAAAKMAGAGAVNTGLRGSSAAPQFGQLLRTASRPSSVFVGSSSPVPPAKATASAEVDVVHKPTWEFDDWEFANFENDMGMDSVGLKPRIVFGAVPSFDEAKEATMEVKEALDKVYLSPSPESDGSNLIVPLNRKIESVSCLSNETSLQSQNSVPQHAIQAFKLLKESAEAQTVVASIASDPNVWNAMLGNEALKSFLQSYQNNKVVEYHELTEGVEEASVGYSIGEQPQNESRNVFQKMLENIKTSIDDMLAKASSFIQNIFGPPPAEVSGGNDEATSGFSTAEKAMGSSIMGLVVIVVAVLLVKRS
ncbi:uncharacterized protein E5676_scaffold110G00240 [Cucumis melo var. makuwa]|uniref:Uncharacterized protein n=2 Tax=Cucumis melo TaxID=3656 RepID=A0A5A7VAL9_CUCMM|nr:uncharacterized protein E6C27_scaffold977G00530 [Cucumis melo var. makuwa]TYJ95761.1 uncharacterized protein E5676_scaffold110G00240 [Cucumis melo var. makuwa]